MAQKRSFRDKLLLAITNSNYKDRGTIHDIVKFYAEKLTDDELMAIESLSEWAKKSDELFSQGVDSILNDDGKRNMFIFELAQAYNEKAEKELEEQKKNWGEQNQNSNEKIRNAADNQSQKNEEIRGTINAISKQRNIVTPISWGFLLIGSIFMGFASVFGKWWGFSEDSLSIIGAAVDAVGLAISVIFFIYEHSSDSKKLGYIGESDQMCKDVKSLAVNIDFNQKQDNSGGNGSGNHSPSARVQDSPGATIIQDSPGAKVQVVQGDNFEPGATQIVEQTNYIEN